jgi:molybdenum cofactor guanylyltransferase
MLVTDQRALPMQERGPLSGSRAGAQRPVRTLGAILAGGKACRFGSDKAAALLDGVSLLDHVSRALAREVGTIVVAGREWPGLVTVADEPGPGLGPLGGLLGALTYARTHRFDQVLASGCDMPDLPPDLLRMLAPAPSYLAGQPLVGLWPSDSAPLLAAHLRQDSRRSMMGWAARLAAREVAPPAPLANINSPAALAEYALRTRAGPRSSP